MAAKKETYTEAMARLEEIVRQIDANELELDVLADKIKEANNSFLFRQTNESGCGNRKITARKAAI